jgi:hypothetical protein
MHIRTVKINMILSLENKFNSNILNCNCPCERVERPQGQFRVRTCCAPCLVLKNV